MAADPFFIPKALMGRFSRQRSLSALLFIASAIVGMVSLLMLVQISGVAATAYEVQRLEELRTYWQESNYRAEVEIARLQSLERVEQEAVNRLKMAPAAEPLVVLVGEVKRSPNATQYPKGRQSTGLEPLGLPWWQELAAWAGRFWGGP